MFLFSFFFAQPQLADGVLAQVGNRVVLYSSVIEESFFRAQFLNIVPEKNPEKFQTIFNEVLKLKIQNSVVFLAAKEDSSNISSEAY